MTSFEGVLRRASAFGADNCHQTELEIPGPGGNHESPQSIYSRIVGEDPGLGKDATQLHRTWIQSRRGAIRSLTLELSRATARVSPGGELVVENSANQEVGAQNVSAKAE